MGDGRTTEQIDRRFLESVTPPPIHAYRRVLLYEFDTEGSRLLPGHIEALMRRVVPELRPTSPAGSVWIGGLASRRGSESINIPLARRRAQAVQIFLLRACPNLLDFTGRHAIVTTSFGETYSAHTENSEYYRSVLVILSQIVVPAPPPRPPRPQPPTTFNRFRIRSKGLSFDGGEGYIAGSYGFEIDYDVAFTGSPPSDPVVYRLRGYVGVGGGPVPFGVSVADPDGPWNPFVSPIVTTTRGFSGRAGIGGRNLQLIVDLGSETHLTLLPAAAHGADIAIDDFQTRSMGFAAGFGTVVGPFELTEGS